MALFRKSPHSTPGANTWHQPEQVYQVLHGLKSHRIPVAVRFAGEDENYSTVVLDASLEKRLFLIDELTPRAGNRKLHAGCEFLIEGHLNGSEFSLRHLHQAGTQMHGDTVLSKIEFPDSVHHGQRRNAFRVEVPAGVRAIARLSGSYRDRPLKGRLLDLSGTGCRVRVGGPMSQEVRAGEPFERCEIEVPGHGSVTVHAEVRFVESGQGLAGGTFGLEFLRPGTREDKQIFRLVQGLQRQARRAGLG